MADNAPTPPAIPNPLHTSGGGMSRRTLYIYGAIGAAILVLVLLIRRNAQKVTAPTATGSAPAPVTIIEPVIPTEAAEDNGSGTGTLPSGGDTNGPPTPVPSPTTTKIGGGDTHGPPTKVQPPKKPPTKKTEPPPTEHTTTYTVENGDTLAEIAARHGISAEALYIENKRVIDSWAQAHGHNPPYQNWIFPGQILTIP